MDEADFQGSDAETSERTCWSGDVRDSGLGHSVATVDMRYVCPKDVKKMLLGQARSTHWRKWAAKHENEESKEGFWLEPARRLDAEKTLRHRLVA